MATLGGVMLFLVACQGPTASNSNNSPEASPSSTPVSNPTTAPSPSPSPSPSGEPEGPALAIASLPFHNGEVGIGYLAVTLTATGGTAPYKWSIGNGTFPAGLTLSSNGVVTGKNTAAGKFTFDVQVADSGGQAASKSASLIVFPPLAVTQPCAKVCYVGVDCTKCGTIGTATGGLGPYTYKVVGGVVPPGMTRNGLSLVGGWQFPLILGPPVDVIGPPPPRIRDYSLTVQVSDRFGATKTVGANWLVFPSMNFNSSEPYAGCYNGSGNCSNNTDLGYFLGSPSDNVTVQVTRVCDGQGACVTEPSQIPAALPPNWTATAKNGVVTVGMDCSIFCQNWYGDVFIVLVDHGSCVAGGHVISATEADVNIDV